MRRAGPALPQRAPRGERGACARELGRVTGFLDAWLAGTSVVTGAGAVAGVVDDDRPRYWYPEIAGYYLSYLATLDCADQRAARIVGWLRRWWSAPGSARETRIAAPGRTAGEDWRNRWLFSFDLAMIVRGLGCHPGLSEAVALREEIAAGSASVSCGGTGRSLPSTDRRCPRSSRAGPRSRGLPSSRRWPPSPRRPRRRSRRPVLGAGA